MPANQRTQKRSHIRLWWAQRPRALLSLAIQLREHNVFMHSFNSRSTHGKRHNNCKGNCTGQDNKYEDHFFSLRSYWYFNIQGLSSVLILFGGRNLYVKNISPRRENVNERNPLRSLFKFFQCRPFIEKSSPKGSF